MEPTLLYATALSIAASANSALLLVGSGFAVPDNDPGGASSSVTTNDPGFISIIVVTLSWPTVTGDGIGRHTWCGDLAATLTFEPQSGGAPIVAPLFTRIGATSALSAGDSSDFAGMFSFADFAPATTIWQAAAAVGPTTAFPGSYRASTRNAAFQYEPVSLMGYFGGLRAAGTWTLTISDHVQGDTGGITSWELFLPSPGSAWLAAPVFAWSIRRRRTLAPGPR